MAKKKRSARRGANARKALAELEKGAKDLQLNIKKLKELCEEFYYFGPGFRPHERKGKY